MSYKVEKDWKYKDLRCVVIMTGAGHRCGYVGVTIEHPLFAVSYRDELPKELQTRWEEVKNGAIGKRSIIDLLCLDSGHPRIGILFDVHGGITYSGGGLLSDYPIQSNLWWFGYDCAHYGDAADIDQIESEALRKLKLQYSTGGVVRSLDYCVAECESLAEQLSDLCSYCPGKK